jgi:choline dehydrogenase-like flavoprotein
MAGASAFDVVIVGGGAAGCVVAARLAESPSRSVLLVEAGPDLRADLPAGFSDAWRPAGAHPPVACSRIDASRQRRSPRPNTSAKAQTHDLLRAAKPTAAGQTPPSLGAMLVSQPKACPSQCPSTVVKTHRVDVRYYSFEVQWS